MSSIVNKVKEALHHDKSTTGTAEGAHGPHSSRVANAADPRVDSDRDGSHTAGRTAGHNEYGSTGLGGTTHGTTHGTGTHGTSEGQFGPHSSRLANAADPRVDSDRDGSHNVGGSGFGTGHTAGHTAGHTTGHTGIDTSPKGYAPGTSRLHDTRPDGPTGYGGVGTLTGTAGSDMTGVTGTHGDPTGTHGPHHSRVANAADPRVDSDRDGRGLHSGTGAGGLHSGTGAGGLHSGTGASGLHSGPGPAANTAGPHKSDVLNKVDPRVDSDLDGSRTVGGNQTYQSGTTTGGIGGGLGRDPTDASQVPPSVLRRHIGEPVIEHDDHLHDRERRNSTMTHQETFRGI